MASSKLFMVLVIAAIFVPSISAVEYVVGDEQGWTVYFDYQSWAYGKVFLVGDKLVFKYKEGTDNVVKVNGTGFRECKAPDGTVPLTSGNDVIELATPGRKWYISGAYGHCDVGQKLFITVLSQWTLPLPPSSLPPSPSEAPTYPAITTGRAESHYGWNAPVSSPPMPSPAPWYPPYWSPIPSPSAPPAAGDSESRPTYSSWYPPYWSPIPSPSASPAAGDSESRPTYSSWYPPYWSPIPSPNASPAARASGSRTTYSWISPWW